ncbi:MAG TPA: large conductance mechanosensitive channel protein MscL [Acidimicrobiia bacterium]
MIKEFREFALKGSLLDVAVGFVLGAAFATVVTSLVDDVIMPIVAGIFGAPDFSELAVQVGEAEIRYGNFINAVIAFLLVALALFLFIVKPMNALRARFAKGEVAEEEVAPSPEAALLAEIRDELRRRPLAQ